MVALDRVNFILSLNTRGLRALKTQKNISLVIKEKM